MTQVKAVGTFVKQNNRIYRKSAYLQWGNSDKSIGSFLLLNPGSAGLNQFDTLLEGEELTSNIELDPTMKQIVKFIERISDNEDLNGRVNLYNLFTLQGTQDSTAIEQFELLCP